MIALVLFFFFLIALREEPIRPGERADDALGPAVDLPQCLNVRLILLERDDVDGSSDPQVVYDGVGCL